jgi:hypothetical protein
MMLPDAGSRIKGNLSLKLKQQLEAGMYGIMARSDIYGASIGKRVVVTEASIVPKAEEASRTEARVVCEVTVEEGSATFSAGRSEAFSYCLKFRHAQSRRKASWCLRCLPHRQVRIVLGVGRAVGLMKETSTTAALRLFLSPQVVAVE